MAERWWSRRALGLHLTVLVVAPGCAVAGWWQATRALSGNELSWAYSIEWPAFSVIAIVVWWNLIHEDPAERQARRMAAAPPVEAPPDQGLVGTAPELDRPTVRGATLLAVAVGAELLVGMLTLFFVPFSRASGWVPSKGAAAYAVHASLGLLVLLAAAAYLVHNHGRGRYPRLVGWVGLACLALAGVGGLMTAATSVVRFLGVALMFVASVLALCTYLIPAALNARARALSLGAEHGAAEARQ